MRRGRPGGIRSFFQTGASHAATEAVMSVPGWLPWGWSGTQALRSGEVQSVQFWRRLAHVSKSIAGRGREMGWDLSPTGQ